MTYASPTTINASKGLGEILIYTNEVTSGWISNLILLAVYVIIIVGYYKARDDFAGGLAVGGFGVFVVALLFWLGGFVSGITLGFAIGLALIGVIVILIDNKNN